MYGQQVTQTTYGGQPYGQPYGQPMGQQVTQTTTYGGQPYGQPYGQQAVTQTTYTQPMGQPYGQPYGQQAVTQTTYSQPMGQQVTQTTTYVSVPQQYNRVQYQWNGMYDRRVPFMVPYGVDQYTADRMIYASEVFRMFDRDFNGVLTFDEFVMIMNYLGYSMHPNETLRTFQMIDADGSGALDEREFVSFFSYACSNGFNFDPVYHRSIRRPITTYFVGRRVGGLVGALLGKRRYY